LSKKSQFSAQFFAKIFQKSKHGSQVLGNQPGLELDVSGRFLGVCAQYRFPGNDWVAEFFSPMFLKK
jgi:hypothetical protein